MSGIEIVSVTQRPGIKAFVDLPWRVYKGDPNWIPPIKSDMAARLDIHKHPFWRFSERALFLALRDQEPVGRIAAIVDGNHNTYHGEKMGAWGFFECVQDPEAAIPLFSAAAAWLKSRGMDFMRGPLNPSTNYEAGMLIRGFDTPPTLMMPYNPPYYPELIRFCGFRKEKDLLAFRVEHGYEPPDWAVSLAERVAQKTEITIRHVNPRRIREDALLLNRVYNECWAHNWGFTPMTDAEMKKNASDMSFILDPDLAFFLCYREEPVGLLVCLPDVNPLLKRLNGRLGISALVGRYLHRSDIRGLRILMFGVKEQYRQAGVPLVAFNHLVKRLIRQERYRYVEAGWTLEDNDAVNNFFVEGGINPNKRYRIYRKDL